MPDKALFCLAGAVILTVIYFCRLFWVSGYNRGLYEATKRFRQRTGEPGDASEYDALDLEELFSEAR